MKINLIKLFVLAVTLVTLGGCIIWAEDGGRGYDRGGGHDRGGHDRGGGHDERH